MTHFTGLRNTAERIYSHMNIVLLQAEMILPKKDNVLVCTLLSAFTVLCGARSELLPERGVCCVFWLNVAAAVIQILTAVIMVGWIMSIFWGMDMVILASQFLFYVALLCRFLWLT
ncbi:Protein stum -like protein [Takifugu flavidus]|uniref:Protein stum-like protein n=1 Tax=Takifugu flavidus TaxID=433684 RepID=A0A5C6NN39_9TELE|nr:Protein stum -like protein [Takifugu flavidus]